MKQIALDTNIAIQILNGNTELIQKIKNFDLVYLPVIVCGELLFGAKNSTKSTANQFKILELINSAIILNINYSVSEEYAQIRKNLKDKGKPIPENDIWIAAICISYQLPLATEDKHFDYVENLLVLPNL